MNKKELVMNIVKPVNYPVTKALLTNHYQGERTPASLENEKKVLVLAPHMDDETIGPGGTLRQHADHGAEIHCLFMTDGGSSVSDLSVEELKQQRKEEIDQVTGILGLTDVSYMNIPDGHVSSSAANIDYVKEKIETINPDVIYCTPYIDAHPDHTATAQLLADTLNEMDRKQVVRLYEINCAFPPDVINFVVDTSKQHDQKVEATNVFASQAIAFDGFLELNKIKGHLTSPKVDAAEVFIEWKTEGFIRHCVAHESMSRKFPKRFKQVNRTDTLLWAIFKNYGLKKDLYRQTI
ncbi:PIG-L deacetylase family protein [Halobacillus litoralis]|uniref:PIG-L deacetylase family protein n=1 Tax=Halobacillus litoralis TaxID=45668 RepID=UPI002490612F|nr:PIG-L deacetylase family protein [Halobacillus litoralis]